MSRRTIASSAATWLRGALLGLVGAGIVMAIAVIVVWPLWFLATVHTLIYTVLVLAGVATATIYLIATRHGRRRRDTP
ncbi:MAG TPA: hypothetical protein VMX33_07645 [bacterium]|nr:hypothetical protein [bacterium]